MREALLAQEAARQGRISGSDSPAGQAADTHRQLMGMKPGGGPRQWVAGVAPTTKGAPTRSLMMRLPTEGGAAELTVPPRPAQLVEKGRGAQGRRPRAANARGFLTQAQMARLRGEQGGGRARSRGRGQQGGGRARGGGRAQCCAVAAAARGRAAAAPREWRERWQPAW